MLRTLSLSLALSLIAAPGVAPAFAEQAQRAGVAGVVPPVQAADSYSVFKPRPSNSRRFDYQVWDEALEDMVLDLGPSLRRRKSRPQAQLGTRIARGHTSPLRLEGSRFTFAHVNDTYQQGLREYREDLERLATRYDIATLPKDEQLAFWLNLHNVALIEKVSEAYPVRRPSKIDMEIDGKEYPLDRAQFMSIKGVPLSLHDIRTKIVYANWPERPEVIYGFFRGDIGGPRLATTAFTGGSVDYQTKANAREFVNSLRGFELERGSRKVSEIYREAAPYYFPDLETDLVSHLDTYAREDVKLDVQQSRPIAFADYETTVADLSGGNGRGASALNTRTLNSIGGGALSFEARQLLQETGEKYRVLLREGLISDGNTGTVIIEDIDTEDLAPDPRYSPLLDSDPSDTP